MLNSKTSVCKHFTESYIYLTLSYFVDLVDAIMVRHKAKKPREVEDIEEFCLQLFFECWEKGC